MFSYITNSFQVKNKRMKKKKIHKKYKTDISFKSSYFFAKSHNLWAKWDKDHENRCTRFAFIRNWVKVWISKICSTYAQLCLWWGFFFFITKKIKICWVTKIYDFKLKNNSIYVQEIILRISTLIKAEKTTVLCESTL